MLVYTSSRTEKRASYPYRYLLAFGSNLGDRRLNCESGLHALEQHGQVLQSSPWVYTAPLTSPSYDCTTHENYLNFVIDFACSLPAQDLYAVIVELENKIGHSREGKWRPRGLDIDILFWAENTEAQFALCKPSPFFKEETSLKIPHSEVWQRPFLVTLLKDGLGIVAEQLRSHQEKHPC